MPNFDKNGNSNGNNSENDSLNQAKILSPKTDDLEDKIEKLIKLETSAIKSMKDATEAIKNSTEEIQNSKEIMKKTNSIMEQSLRNQEVMVNYIYNAIKKEEEQKKK